MPNSLTRHILFLGNGTELRLSGAERSLFVRHPTAFGGSPLHQFPGVGAFDRCPAMAVFRVS